MKKREKAKRMGLFIKTVAICIGKKVGHYYQNNDQGRKLLFIVLDEYIM